MVCTACSPRDKAWAQSPEHTMRGALEDWMQSGQSARPQ
jgi:hypothetical protein